MGKLAVNPFALGAAFVERAVELGWLEVESDGMRSSYYLTDSGSSELVKFGVNLDKAMQFAVLQERNNVAQRKRPFPLQAHTRSKGHPRQHAGAVRSGHGHPVHDARGHRPKRRMGPARGPVRHV
ncbi:MAG: hypothetical protein JW952_03075 [Candidatus Eisenbacteria bacterium]|nr:hypothetical protein [Candidatus Eisenbacteria bacterium]